MGQEGRTLSKKNPSELRGLNTKQVKPNGLGGLDTSQKKKS